MSEVGWTYHKLDQQIRNWINGAKFVSTDQKQIDKAKVRSTAQNLDQQIKSWKDRLTNQKLDQQIKS